MNGKTAVLRRIGNIDFEGGNQFDARDQFFVRIFWYLSRIVQNTVNTKTDDNARVFCFYVHIGGIESEPSTQQQCYEVSGGRAFNLGLERRKIIHHVFYFFQIFGMNINIFGQRFYDRQSPVEFEDARKTIVRNDIERTMGMREIFQSFEKFLCFLLRRINRAQTNFILGRIKTDSVDEFGLLFANLFQSLLTNGKFFKINMRISNTGRKPHGFCLLFMLSNRRHFFFQRFILILPKHNWSLFGCSLLFWINQIIE